MRHECGLCLRDNKICKCGKSFWQLLVGNVVGCMLFEDYNKGLLKQKKIKKRC